jgi:hypothetical protein
MKKRITFSEYKRLNRTIHPSTGLEAAKNILKNVERDIESGTIELGEVIITSESDDIEVAFTSREYVQLAQAAVDWAIERNQPQQNEGN